MHISKKTPVILITILLLPFAECFPQHLKNISIAGNAGLTAVNISLDDGTMLNFPRAKPLFTFTLNGKTYSTENSEVSISDSSYILTYENRLRISFFTGDSSQVWKGTISFRNIGADTLSLGNVVPFGNDQANIFITAGGPPALARALIFRPGYRPVKVILPDNAWEMGYSSFAVQNGISLCAVTRRKEVNGGTLKRYETLLPQGASVSYDVHAEIFKGEWQNGLRLMFRDRYLYDLEKFDISLYERSDLEWIRNSYLIILQMAWDREFYDRMTGKFTYPEIIKKSIDLFGNIDVYGLWPTWPRLGLDDQNQWDMYRNIPGGTDQIRNISRLLKQYGTRFFITYNPWDNSTKKEDHFKGMASMIKATEADGVILDTMSGSNVGLQNAADSVRKGVVMYPEGMALPKDMQRIISGRVHNAIYLSPELNLNKLIKSDFSIFRVCEIGEGAIHRETAVAFFNGYGTELNMFRPGGRDDNYRKDLEFLARTTFILRQNNDAFLDRNWTPLVETVLDNVYVNRWRSGDKTLYTVLNMRQEGIDGKLIKTAVSEGRHFVSLWNHEEIIPVKEKESAFLKVNASGWLPEDTGTRKEGSVDCIAEFPVLINAQIEGDSLKIKGIVNKTITVWKGNPSYQAQKKEYMIAGDTVLGLKDIFGYYEGRIVLQMIENKILKDECIVNVKFGKPWLISTNLPTIKATIIPAGMVLVPGASVTMNSTAGENFIPYPELKRGAIEVDSFLIDKYPVTNAEYYEFIVNTGYRPSDTTHYLRHWKDGKFRQGQDKYPVVYVSREDITAYARWSKKRLPTEAEWQLAAQGTDNRKWPWGDEFHGTYCNNSFNRPTPVDAFSKGQSPCGVMDLVGNVWQMTNDMYFNGYNYFVIIRGGSYYNPDSGSWYIKGGPQELGKTQMLLMVSPGFDRSATLGFRCVMDVDKTVIKPKRKE
jgi:formylglycine-generating enzyme required for sulfatase activity